MHSWLHCASTDGGLFPPSCLLLLAGTSKKSLEKKMVAYAQALQCLMEQNNLPKKDQPCLLVESVAELRREVGFYLSFTDEEVFRGVDLPKEVGSKPSAPTTAATDTPGTTATVETLSI